MIEKRLNEELLLIQLLADEEYSQQVLPFLRQEFFDREYGVIFQAIKDYFEKWRKAISLATLLETLKNTDKDAQNVLKLISQWNIKKDENHEWLLEATDKFVRDKELTDATFKLFEATDKNPSLDSKSVSPKSYGQPRCFDFCRSTRQ
jgi:hypothetical protein